MPPIKPANTPDEDLIAQIKQRLLDYEEPYAPGAWERFDEKKNKRRGLIFWIGGLSSAAAGLLLVGGLYFFNRENTVQQPVELATQHQKITDPLEPKESADATMKADDTATLSASPEKFAAGPQTKIQTQNTLAPITDAINPGQSTLRNGLEVQTPVVPAGQVPVQGTISTGAAVTAVRPAEQNGKAAFQDFLTKESATNQETVLVSNTKSEKWEMGVLVAPSFGNTKKLNMGYGLSMAYAVSDKVSLSSGISYNELAASKNMSASSGGGSYSDAPVGPSIAGESKSLSSVETHVVGIDIPLELKYHLSKRVYANIGVSAFAVLSQRQNNNYIESKLVQNSGLAYDNANSFTNTLVSERTTEKAPETEVSQDKYLGFYNFSFGYKQKISKSNSIAIEPFMKVPMKEVSKDNLRLIGTGVRLKFDF